MAKNPGYGEVRETIRALTKGETDEVALMATVVCDLYCHFERFDWVGFYRVTEPEVMRIGPYQGDQGCLVIPFSCGVCGAAAREGRTQVVADVGAFAGHIACAAPTRSEIVVPVYGRAGQLIAVLYIGSNTLDNFDAADQAELEAMLAEVFGQSADRADAPAERDESRLWVHGLLEAHIVIAVLAWLGALTIGLVEDRLDAEFEQAKTLISLVLVVSSLIVVIGVVHAFFQENVKPFATVIVMLGHAALIILVYAAIYRMLPYSGEDCQVGGGNDFYFSMVTFTTLGYGDCAPTGPTRFFAAFQAVVSYLFIGIVAGMFASMKRPDISRTCNSGVEAMKGILVSDTGPRRPQPTSCPGLT